MKTFEATRKAKADFLKKLQSGKFTLKPVKNRLPGKRFDRQESGFYLCESTGEILSQDEIKLQEGDYDLCIEIVSDLNTPAAGYQLVNIEYSELDYLSSLLVQKD